MKPFVAFLLLVCSLAPRLSAQEFRGVWIATVFGIDWPKQTGTTPAVIKKQKADLLKLFDQAKDLKLNAVCLQVRPMADALYCSGVGEPPSAYVSGQRGVDPGWDPLEFATSEAHKRGLALYAWLNPFRADKGTRGKDVIVWDKYTVHNPALESVRSHVVDVVRDIITNYRVDGIIFDDYFYPNKLPENQKAPDYALWQQTAPTLTFGDFRRASVHKAIADVSAMIEDVRPDVRFGISPAGVAGKSETSARLHGVDPVAVKAADWQWGEIYSDPVAWLKQGTIDFISPQIYWQRGHATAPYEPIARWWSDVAAQCGRHVYVSHSLTDTKKGKTPPAEFRAQVDINHKYDKTGAPGSIFYSAKNLSRLPQDLYASQALIPAVTWRPGRELPKVTGLKRNGDTLVWNAVEALPATYVGDGDGPDEIIKYAVYDGDRLVGVTYEPQFQGAGISAPRVRVVDGYGNLGK